MEIFSELLDGNIHTHHTHELFAIRIELKLMGQLVCLVVSTNHPPSVRSFWDGPIPFSDGILLGWCGEGHSIKGHPTARGFDFRGYEKKMQIYHFPKDSRTSLTNNLTQRTIPTLVSNLECCYQSQLDGAAAFVSFKLKFNCAHMAIVSY